MELIPALLIIGFAVLFLGGVGSAPPAPPVVVIQTEPRDAPAVGCAPAVLLCIVVLLVLLLLGR